MGSGKTSCGEKIARKLSMDFYDLDAYIEANEGETISGIFKSSGEIYFRKKEQEYLGKLFQKENIVVATGGGTPCYFSNMAEINKNGISVYLKMSNKALLSRLAGSSDNRPLLKNINKEHLLEFIEKTMDERTKFYNKANIVVSGLNFCLESVLLQIGQHAKRL